MLNFLPAPVLFVLNASLAALSILFWSSVILVVAIVKMVIPVKGIRLKLSWLLNHMMRGWVITNALVFRLTTKTQWNITGLSDTLSTQGWYLVISNHMSWADIFVVSIVLRDKVPMLKFFLKHQLIYIPIMGVACWALDMPFMRRYSKSELTKNPKLKGKDIETTRRSCSKFKEIPTTVINFIEGSRLTPSKHRRQRSPYRYLLKPKAGGIAFAMATLGNQFEHVLDLTIVYPGAPENIMAALLSGRLDTIAVDVRVIPMTEVPQGNYDQDKAHRVVFQRWLNQVWEHKDTTIDALLKQHQHKPGFYEALASK
ncbi:1-acyl-sn-glycerol-3-phosphate acyltransferase [Ferrimonas sediminum]|uniref:1-acyl-sn-glycerol-3-phosphate acyltransferase n=1 Tax=Ferrimonas sediminum TaxID=718193 RepID=A0A1G8JMR1_9GAMM|nr:acyltransferase [Ferrimonas sediminum]SDI32544.1 1-acyl-sn-glycerol-3-phosphate acyltransferase [Ferrimonas sediminum]